LEDEIREPLMIPHAALPTEVLRAVVESFVLREGTDYGEKEVALEQKVADVLRQINIGEARIVFDPASQSVDVVIAPGTRMRRA
jgi:uncharacterized protein YheU (UPF0270 family)